MKKILVLTWLLLFAFQLKAQPQYADSLKNTLSDKSIPEKDRIDLLNSLAYSVRSSDPALSFQCGKDALTSSEEMAYKKGKGDAHLNLCYYYWTRSEYEKGLEHGLSALRVFEFLDNQKGLMDCYFLMGATYNQLNDTIKSDDYINRSLTLAQELRNNEAIARIYNSRGIEIINRKGEYDKAREIFLNGLKLLQENNNSYTKAYLLGNLGLVYRFKDDYDKALEYLNEALEIAKHQKNLHALAFVHLQLACTQMDRLEYAKAEEHFKISTQLSKKTGTRKILLNNYISLIDLKLRMDNNKEAHEYQKQYAFVRDSIFNAERAQKIAELEASFETEKKEEAISQLEQESHTQAIWRNVLIVGFLIISVAAFFIYRLQRSRALKTKELLEVQRMFNEKLKEIDRIKSNFFANISHEFRTPLTLILAPLEEELKKNLQESEREPLMLMKRNANRLLELVNQLLDLSKLEARKMQLHVRLGHTGTVLHVLSASFDSFAQQKHIHFVKNIQVQEALWYDEDKLEKIITNLLSNAFKFTAANGTVTLSAHTKNTDSGTLLHITVEDTGCGIPAEEQEHIFSPFYQIKQSSVSINGTGLGLSLVKELIKLYNGTVTFQSKVNVGTTFTITLPASKNAFTADQIIDADVNDSQEYTVDSIDGIDSDDKQELLLQGADSILIAEDNAELLNFMASKLKKDFTVFTATNGEEALHLALKVIPNLVLSDLMMPKLDGMQLTEKIKTDERTSHIPVVLLTAKNEQQTRITGFKTGADDYITKPFSTEELLVRITNLIEQRKKLAEHFRERILVNTTPSPEASLDDRFIHKVREVTESNMSDFNFTVEQLAEEVNLSRTQLLRKLKALTGLSPNEFIKDMRLKRAADMIRQRVDTITQIGYAVGFNDQSYFTKCFKKQFNVTPSEYLAQFTDKK